MAKRNPVQEVLEIKSRNKHSSRTHILYSRFRPLSEALEAGGFKDELMRYFPIGVVALMEVYFRAVYAELLDEGAPYADRVQPLVKDLKLEWQAIRAIEGRRITSGEFVSHMLPLNSLGDIQRVMNTLIDADFCETLKEMENYGYRLVRVPSGTKMALPDPDETFKAVARTFELRHILCHEPATSMQLDKSDVQHCMHECALFLGATESLLMKLYYPKPMTQFELTEKADKEYQEALKGVQEAERRVIAGVDKRGRELLDIAQMKWGEFSKADAEFSTHLWAGGSAHGMARLIAMKEDAVSRREKLLRYSEDLSNV